MDGGFRIKERVAFLFGSVVAMEIMEYYGLTKKEISEELARNRHWLEMFAETAMKFDFSLEEVHEAIDINVEYYSDHKQALSKLTGTIINRRKSGWS